MATSKNPLGGRLNFQPEAPNGGMGTMKTYENLRVQANQRAASPTIYPSRIIKFSQSMTTADYAIGIDTTTAAVNLTLLSANTAPPCSVKVVWVAGSNAATITPLPDDKINGASGAITLGSLWTSVELLMVGSNAWWKLT
jgi:hypothetical protein